MRLSKYPVNIHDENTYWFISTGRTGNIIKAVLFQELPEDNRVNLAMGDAGKTEEINFEDLSNNGDTRKVFNTIGKIVKKIIQRVIPEKEIFVTGNTSDKKRI